MCSLGLLGFGVGVFGFLWWLWSVVLGLHTCLCCGFGYCLAACGFDCYYVLLIVLGFVLCMRVLALRWC